MDRHPHQRKTRVSLPTSDFASTVTYELSDAMEVRFSRSS